jgi:DNA-directed RNA polymerase specialized sigma subunit
MIPIAENGELVTTGQKRGTSELGREEIVSLLAKFSPESKKILAMYYHENMRLPDIAACLGLAESDVCQIYAQSLASLRRQIPSG